MPTPVKLPRLGESVAEGTVAAWLKKEGDWIEKDEALAEIVTDKINAELPSPVAGRLVKILVQAEETVAVGTDIALIEEEVAQAQAAPQDHEPPQAASAPALAGRTSNGALGSESENGERQRISPLARRLAREHGIDLNEIRGTGIGGRVRKEDIMGYLAQRQVVAAQPAARAPEPPRTPVAPVEPPVSPSQARAGMETSGAAAFAPVEPLRSPITAEAGPDEEIIVPSRMRLAIAEHMVRSKHTAPHATTVVEVDMTAIARWLERHKEEFKRREGYSISYVPFVMKAVCEGIRQVPLINSTWTEDNRIIVKKRIHLGIAVATDAGLVVPTVHDADQYTIAGLARKVNEVAQRARSNRLTVQDLQGSTFVVNNPGTFGTILSVPIINQPHAGILSMDAVVKRPVVTEDDAIAIRSMMYLCLSFDHRILDGAGAAAFLQAVRAKLQSYGAEIDVY